MTSDRELLEAAAKAAGYAVAFNGDYFPKWKPSAKTGRIFWNPLTDDGDALRLAVKLEIDIRHFGTFVDCEKRGGSIWPAYDKDEGDRLAATRRAIVRAAAAIGEGKP